MSTSASASASASASSFKKATEKQQAFNVKLANFMKTLRDRCAKEAELDEELRQAINLIEVGSQFEPAQPITTFNEVFVNNKLIRHVRNRDTKAALAHIHEIGKEHKSEIIVALGHLGANSALDSGIMPWKMLSDLYKMGAGIDVDKKVEARVYSFNDKYRDFLENMSHAFPCTEFPPEKMLKRFDTATLFDPWAVYSIFKDVAKPYIELITQGMGGVMGGGNDGGNGESATAASATAAASATHKLEDIYHDPSVVYARLPFMEDLPLARYWDVQVLKNEENYKYMTEMFTQMTMTVVGLPGSLFSTDIVGTVKDFVMKELEGKNIDNSAPAAEQGTGEIMEMAMSIMQKMQTSGHLDEILGVLANDSFDVDTDMPNAMASNVNLPPDLQLMIDAAQVQEQPICKSVSKITDEDPK